MEDRFKIIVITPREEIEDESVKIIKLLRAGADIVSLRHPEAAREQIEAILDNIPSELRERIHLHDYPELAREYGTGFQLNSRYREAEGIRAERLSASIHSINEIAGTGSVDYVTLSPIFDSISKPGYTSNIDLNTLHLDKTNSKVVALGGVTPDRIPMLREKGFAGAALSGHVWRDNNSFDKFIRFLHMRNSVLQYITDGVTPEETVRLALEALKGGCRWVQIRMKDQPHEVVKKVAEELSRHFTTTGATLIVDDLTEIAAEVDGVAGVHLGQNDMTPGEARKILSNDAIIGLTINNIEQLNDASVRHRDYIDYLGIGPLRFTSTKKRLAPTLGIDGYRKMIAEMHRLKFMPPFVAIGGITATDIKILVETGVPGVAISGAIGKADSPADATAEIVQALRACLDKKIQIHQ